MSLDVAGLMITSSFMMSNRWSDDNSSTWRCNKLFSETSSSTLKSDMLTSNGASSSIVSSVLVKRPERLVDEGESDLGERDRGFSENGKNWISCCEKILPGLSAVLLSILHLCFSLPNHRSRMELLHERIVEGLSLLPYNPLLRYLLHTLSLTQLVSNSSKLGTFSDSFFLPLQDIRRPFTI